MITVIDILSNTFGEYDSEPAVMEAVKTIYLDIEDECGEREAIKYLQAMIKHARSVSMHHKSFYERYKKLTNAINHFILIDKPFLAMSDSSDSSEETINF
jgi:hypothetical protein